MSTELPPQYSVDHAGRRVIRGLTIDQTIEFELLDASLPYAGKLLWLDQSDPPAAQQRWLELWAKHRDAAQGSSPRS
jgi:hypothetical protein